MKTGILCGAFAAALAAVALMLAPSSDVSAAEPYAVLRTPHPQPVPLGMQFGPWPRSERGSHQLVFAMDSSEIGPSVALELDRIADWLQRNPSVFLSVRGRVGLREDAAALRGGEIRAANVKAYLMAKGVRAIRLSMGKVHAPPGLCAGNDRVRYYSATVTLTVILPCAPPYPRPSPDKPRPDVGYEMSSLQPAAPGAGTPTAF